MAPECNPMFATDQLVVPVAVPLAPVLVVHVTCVTPTLSLAVPLNVIELVLVANVAPLVGAVIAMVGDCVSVDPAVVYVTVKVFEATLFAAS